MEPANKPARRVGTFTLGIVLVVSEETGAISVAREGKLIRYLDEKAVHDLLTGLLASGTTVMPWSRLMRKEGARHAE